MVRITYDKNGQEMTPDVWEGDSVLLEPGKKYTIEILSVGNAGKPGIVSPVSVKELRNELDFGAK